MKIGETTLKLLMYACRFNFGAFEKEEFKKFLRMRLIFALIIGIYRTLRALKDSIFIKLVDRMHLSYAKAFSVLALVPLVMFYTKLLEKTPREKMLIILPSFLSIVLPVRYFSRAAPNHLLIPFHGRNEKKVVC